MAQARLPPGFRFHPTDEELVSYYLKRKVMGKHFRFMAVSEVEIYKYAPWDLPEKSCFSTKDLEWYFFCPRDKKYPKGSRANRSTKIGYWKTTGKDRSIVNGSRVVGMKKSLIFHKGKPPKGDRTDWVMYEYRLTDEQLAASGVAQDAFVLCKIFKKSGMGPKIGEQYGAPFNEEDWEDDADLEASMAAFPFLPCQPVAQLTNDNNATTSLPEHTPRSVPATAITEHVLTTGSITIVEPVPVSVSVSAAPLLEPVPLSESVDIHSAVVPLASESFAINSAVPGAGWYNELADITGPPFSMPQNSTALPSTPEMDGIQLDELAYLIGAPSFPGNFLNQLTPEQPPPAVVANFNETTGDETKIFGELTDLADGFLNDGNVVDELNHTIASNNNLSQPSVSEPEHFVELNDIFCDQEPSFFPDFYNFANSPEMDIDAIFFRGTNPS